MNKHLQTLPDQIAEAKKDNRFFLYSKSARVVVRLAVEVYEKRKQRGWSQAQLAKEIGTTQRVISNIETGDVEVGIGLLKRLIDGLLLTTQDLGIVFDSNYLYSTHDNTANAKLVNPLQNELKEYTTVNNYLYATSQR